MVTVMKPNSLREAIELAQVYTSSLGNTEKVNYIKTKGNLGKFNKNGNTKNYDKGKWKDSQTAKKPNVKKIKCYNCNKIGDVKANCRLKKPFHRVKMVEEIVRGEPETLRTKISTKIENVYSCSLGKIMKVVGTINNNSVVYALDSDASRSVVAYKKINKFNFKINPTNIQVKVADKTINVAIGETDTLRICIGNSIIYQKFLIMDLDDNDVLLGFDWFLKRGATLTPVEKSLKLPNDTVYLELSNEYYEYY
ncbi:unnamed protein product [Brachionus calyciflorus]|uniref:CCHC-type domain-containing protein n=1 Tax=Brachionus calyciflorus TaxID=104777 RepID=A0A813NW18_9BILA|nr:unnamed protein product [Brachionus calyciflorus]